MTQNKTDKRKTRAEAKKNAEKRARIIAGVVIVLLIAGIAWEVIFSQKPAAKNSKQYSAYPAMVIDKAKKYTATFKMAKGGEFTAELYADKAPKTVNSFVFLAREKYFDGLTFHRVIDGFMAQGGDPTGTGSGGPGYMFEYEDSGLKFDKPGVMAMANQVRNHPPTAVNSSSPSDRHLSLTAVTQYLARSPKAWMWSME